jgi:LmbE family N-acetylglucosaminyl deacetylase
MQARTIKPQVFPQWQDSMDILVILAHPDDPEFFLGGTIAEWVKQGHKVSYLLLTKGQRGVSPEFPDPDMLEEVRVREQSNAAKSLGVDDIFFLDFQDGFLMPDLEARRKVTREIRRLQPDVVVSCDPLLLYQWGRINHPDHRAAGQIVIDAIFPAAGNPAFYPELLEEGLSQHQVKELWLSLPLEANFETDVTQNWQLRLDALLKHVSQIGDPQTFLERMECFRQAQSGEDMRYIELFRRIIL